MTCGKHEAVAVGPQRIRGIVFQKTLPQRIDNRGQAHGRAGMPGIRLLHGINGERPDGVDAQLIDVLLAHSVSLADQGMTATWVQGLDAAPAGKAPKLYSKRGLAGLHGWCAGYSQVSCSGRGAVGSESPEVVTLH